MIMQLNNIIIYIYHPNPRSDWFNHFIWRIYLNQKNLPKKLTKEIVKNAWSPSIFISQVSQWFQLIKNELSYKIQLILCKYASPWSTQKDCQNDNRLSRFRHCLKFQFINIVQTSFQKRKWKQTKKAWNLKIFSAFSSLKASH